MTDKQRGKRILMLIESGDLLNIDHGAAVRATIIPIDHLLGKERQGDKNAHTKLVKEAILLRNYLNF